jgi:hypothetical protein
MRNLSVLSYLSAVGIVSSVRREQEIWRRGGREGGSMEEGRRDRGNGEDEGRDSERDG